MAIEDDISVVARQETQLMLRAFGPEEAWALGTRLRGMAVARGLSLVVDVRRLGSPHQPLFFCALDGTTPDNARWVERKVNVVARFHKSSYHVGLLLKQAGLSFGERYGLNEEEYAAHGGGFPLRVTGAGVVGCVTVSGLPQREDHSLVVEALCGLLAIDDAELRLSE